MCGKGTLQPNSARSSSSNLSKLLDQQPSPAISPSPEEDQHPFFDYKAERAHLHVSRHAAAASPSIWADLDMFLAYRTSRRSVVSFLLQCQSRRLDSATASQSTELAHQ